ncbi:hypothetical protein GGQ88_000109 [Novosphingobium hassiacum]|uniref:Peptidase S74 domain-containing protein n=1 Tax=Novosphingobium hassiacum TaxID=173676 RepID=A0A7W5ZUW6_9SPHN|nr:tail fiber domain-containing protein [Novosphingobium hassiacum]MBB3858869.1 hypothetical protein [Novosphingobium hassiacum]
MAIEQDWEAYANQGTLGATDTILARTAAGAGVEVPGSALARVDALYGVPALGAVGGGVSANTDGAAYFGGCAFYAGNFRNTISGQGGWAARNSGGVFTVFTGNNPGPAGSIIGMSERMRIDGSGVFHFCTASASGLYNGSSNNPGVVIEPSGTLLIQRNSGTNCWMSKAAGYSDGGYVAFAVNGVGVGGISTNGSSTSYSTSSDYRLKDDLKPLTGALDRILSLPVYDFRWKTTGERAHGFMAHEYGEVIRGGATGKKDGMREEIVIVEPAVEPVFDEAGGLVTPGVEAVTRTELVPDYQGIDQSKVTPDLVGAVQEMAGIIEELRARVAALEAM